MSVAEKVSRRPSGGEAVLDSDLSEDAPRTGTHPVLRRCLAARMVAGAAALGLLLLASGSVRSMAQDEGPVALTDLVAVTDHIIKHTHAGCNDLTIADSSNGSVVSRAGTNRVDTPSAGQLTSTSDGHLFAWLSDNNGWFVHIMIWQPTERRWRLGTFYDGPLKQATGGAIAISPDDETLLVADDNTLRKYQIANVSQSSLGPVVKLTIDADLPRSGRWLDATVPAAIEYTADSQTAYVVVNDGFVYTLDVDAMSWRGSPIPYPVTAGEKSYCARRTFASLSPDEHWLLVNGGNRARGGGVSLVDLQGRKTEQIDAPELSETWGVDFNSVGGDRGLLAVHGRSRLGVYHLADRRLVLVEWAGITPPGELNWTPRGRWQARFASLAWSGDGTRVIANQGGAKEWRIFELTTESPRRLKSVAIFESCQYNDQGSQGFDVVTLQKRPTLTTTPTASATPTTTMTPSPSSTSTSTLSPPPTATPSLTPIPSLTPTNTPEPLSLFLPITLSERCDSEHKRADIALVPDTSSSMTGQKLEDAKQAALLFVGMIDLDPGRSQVTVVRYDREADVVRELTRSRALIEAAIRSLQVRSGTHIDKGLRSALEELQSPRHVERNMPVMILLTDGLQTGTPGEELRAATEVRQAGVRLYTIGLGSDVDEAALRSMAGDDSRYYNAPDSGDLARIYAEIAQDLMCPGQELWGGR